MPEARQGSHSWESLFNYIHSNRERAFHSILQCTELVSIKFTQNPEYYETRVGIASLFMLISVCLINLQYKIFYVEEVFECICRLMKCKQKTNKKFT